MAHPLVKNHRFEEYDVYIGRGKQIGWGNPFSHLKHAKGTILVSTRDEAVERYRDYALQTFSTLELAELHGKRLGCWCAPKRCHGEILVELAEQAWQDLHSDDES